LAVYGMAAAQLLFDDDDALWYVLAGGAFFNEERWHPAPGDEAQLVRVPVLRWGTLSPALTDLRQIEDPFEAVERQQALLLAERLEEARAFVLGTLSGAEQRVLELLVREGLSNAEIAERLSLSPRTVERHLGEISGRAGVKWGLENVSRAQLIALLNFYYVTRSAGDGNGEDGGKYA
jgi:ATP/maltotriose-dependent transcriptional regulator MalT